jgi:CO/xanthine dehydrogenase FAD-binding subunit
VTDGNPLEIGWVSRGHGSIAPFDLVRASRVDDAVAAHGVDARPGAAYIAGGIDQVNRMQDGAAPDRLIDISRVYGLRDIWDKGEVLNIGACVSHYRIETDALVAKLAPDLAACWATIGNIRIRMAGTIGGNVMARHANYDGPVLLAACGARYVFDNPNGTSSLIDAEHHPDASGTPPGALMTRIVIPTGGERRLIFDRSLKPVISVAVATEPNGVGRAAVGCALAAPVCVHFDAGGSLASRAASIAGDIADALPPLLDNAFASAGYRRRMARVLLERQLIRLGEMG